MNDKHFWLTVSGKDHSTNARMVIADLGGCRDCLRKAITMLMVEDAEFRTLINEAGKAANVVRENRRRGGPDVNPQNN